MYGFEGETVMGTLGCEGPETCIDKVGGSGEYVRSADACCC